MSPQVTAAEQLPSILIVDDEDYVADMIATTLEMEGYHADIAYNGLDGLARAERRSFDMIIVDVMMPYLSGPDMVQQLRTLDHARQTPILLISVGPRPPLDASFVTFLRKPFDIDTMLELVRVAVQQGKFRA